MGKHFFSGLLGAFVGAFIVIIFLHFFIKAPASNPADVKTPSSSAQTTVISEGNEITRAVEKISPSVVNIDTKVLKEIRRPAGGFGNFFGYPNYETQIVPQQGQGSGVIIDPKGLILTNEHVIHGANEIMVTLSDERRVPGKIKGLDQLSDVAIVQIDTSGLPAAEMGDSDKLRIGESVIAVGNPYQFQHTVTVGVLSGRGRSLSEHTKDFQDLLQTDAAINPGNSGGPLVNVKGEVIGINTAIVPYAQGIGFAIPINTAKNVMEQLLSKGKVSRPFIGIYMQDVNAQLAQYLNLPMTEGAIIVDVMPGSPADVARLQKKDVVTEIGGKQIKTSEDVRKYLHSVKIGDAVPLTVWRDGKTDKITIKVVEAP
ncbi:MAG: S1C family serine protease [Candidatus Xenobiia bacterium LiM19]